MNSRRSRYNQHNNYYRATHSDIIHSRPASPSQISLTAKPKKKAGLIQCVYSKASQILASTSAHLSSYSFSSTDNGAEDSVGNDTGASRPRVHRLPKSRSLIVCLPSWQESANKTKNPCIRAVVDGANGVPQAGDGEQQSSDTVVDDFAIFTASPVHSPIFVRMNSARSHRGRFGYRWNKHKRCRTMSELRIAL